MKQTGVESTAGMLNRSCFNEFTDLPIPQTLSILSRFALTLKIPLHITKNGLESFKTYSTSQSFCTQKQEIGVSEIQLFSFNFFFAVGHTNEMIDNKIIAFIIQGIIAQGEYRHKNAPDLGCKEAASKQPRCFSQRWEGGRPRLRAKLQLIGTAHIFPI